MTRPAPTALPYGAWASPLAPSDLAAAVVGLDDGVVDGEVTYWTEAYPQQAGRVALWRRGPDGTRTEVAPQDCVRNAINEYGGGAWAAAGGIVVYSRHPSGELWVVEDGLRRRLAPGGDRRWGCLVLVPERRLVLAVREDHATAPCTQALVVLTLDALNTSGGRVLAEGADFYASPAVDADGRVAWVQWDLPDMPWDATGLWVAPLDGTAPARQVAGGPGISVVHPAWAQDGSLVFLSDASGYWNFACWDGTGVRPLHEHPWDFCGPLWTPGRAPYSVLPGGGLGCSWLVDGVAHVGVLSGGELAEFDLGVTSCTLSGRGERVVALCGHADRPAELRLLDLGTGATEVLARAGAGTLPQGWISLARPLTWDSPDGPVHGWYYPPTSPDHLGTPGELPPVQVWTHGGPTGFSPPDFRVATQFWTTRGIGILDVNYSGSTGYGRAYRSRLEGAWGLSDVRDCVAGAAALVEAGLADPARLSIRGSSAGGFTTLAALTGTDVFAAGISLYGIADLTALVDTGHKFESRYLDRLVAPWPQGRQVYRDRSPIHHLDRLSRPMLVLQGGLDKVVPPSQAEALVAAVRARGLEAELVTFPEEGHGFRRSESIITTAQRCLAFLAHVHGFTPA